MTIKEAIQEIENAEIQKGFLNGFACCRNIKDLLKQYEWHPYPQEKPKKGGEYLVKQKMDEHTFILNYVINSTTWEENGIVAWMEIPKYEEE